MKKIFTVILVLKFLLLSVILGFNCAIAQGVGSSLVGVWRMDGTKTFQSLKSEDKDKMDQASEVQKSAFNQSLESRIYFFNDDQSFQAEWISNNKPQKISGTWKYDGEAILEIIVNGETKVYSVVLEKSNLMLKPQAMSGGMLNQLFFTKVK
ncbi:lipocalin family protein [Belliella kenyensis]|uniref:Lipocalin family protein n=1 Tax=Belliella kenyensis TaxID=1472724 RepID=A0ABV8ELH4_9BACT|nr:lipocalin family protein [Belliella kenyensis]MCH7400746.1 lipocalin family protein [Belliella kenyensis]MDN3601967.1 lipocalin family protein [Belliella kenyensis]